MEPNRMEPEAEKVERPVYHWKEVTQEFFEATSELGLGELLHDSTFGLFEAMSAIEMMDPKMDAGMMCNQIKRRVMSLEESIEVGTVKVDNLTPEELVGIMDSTLACLVTWLEGHSLAQTVFTNLYLHNPSLIKDRTLRAFSICMLKLVDLIRDRINRANVFEEEDFQPMTYGFKLASDVTDMRATGMLKEVEDDLNRVIKTTRNKPGEERDAATEKEHVLALVVYSRVRFHRLFLSMLLAFSKDKSEGIVQAQKLLGQMLELMPNMEGSVSLGIMPEEREVTKNDYPTIMGFEPLINQRLLPPTFPRYTVIFSRSAALSYMKQLLLSLQVAASVTEMTSLFQILQTFLEFSKCSPCVLARSILQLTFLPPNRRVFGIHPMTDFMRDTIKNFIAPPALCSKTLLQGNPQAKEFIDSLLSHAIRPICTVFQITGNNRARQRDKWAHVLEELAMLQEEADKVDGFLHGLMMKQESQRNHLACFGTFVLYHTLTAMLAYTLAGFELELYAPYEYHYVYWYLYELLSAWMVSALQRADNFLLEYEMADQGRGRGNKKNKKKKRTRTHARDITIAQALQSLYGGYYKAVVGFQLNGKLKQPEFQFDSEEVRYSHRFAPFANVVTPPLVLYMQYKDMSDVTRMKYEPTAEELFAESAKCFNQAKVYLESLPSPNSEMQTLVKVAKTNLVVMNLLVQGHKKDSQAPPEFLFTQHKVYPIIKVV